MDFTRLTTISLLSTLLIVSCDNQSDVEKKPSISKVTNKSSEQTVTENLSAQKISADYICAHLLVKTDLFGNNLTLSIEDKSYQLSLVESASGSKYTSKNNNVSFWQKTNGAILELNGQRYSNCEKVTVQQSGSDNKHLRLPFTATGNEPGWSFNLTKDELEFNTDYGQKTIRTAITHTPLIESGKTIQFEADGKVLTLLAEKTLCHDSMSGMPYPYTISIQQEEDTYTGCGGQPSSLLTRTPWSVLTINDQMLVQDSRISLNFNNTSQLAGVASCNRYSTSYTLTGEGLSIGSITTTLMACDPALMEQEASFLKYLANVTRFDINDSGQLVLYTSQGASLLAKPEIQ